MGGAGDAPAAQKDMLEIRNIRKEYRTGELVQKALDGVSLALRDNEFVAVLGPSGSGKTTLLNIIGGLDHYDSGEMLIDGVPTSRYTERDWDAYRNHTIGFIFQSYHLIPHQTLLSNVEMALTLTGVQKEERQRRALEALDRVGLKEQAHKKPAQLSGGQMQRVAIARALINDPAVVLADEPTGALDSETGEQVMEMLREVAKDRLVVMVTHNPELADRYATRIVRVKDGRVTEDSDPFDPAEQGNGKADGGTAEKAAGGKPARKPSMSVATSVSLSVSNLLSKKGRTVLVAFAASIGIIGIAMILSLSYGANSYIRAMEEASLSQYPLDISNSSFSMEDMMMSVTGMMQENAATSENTVDEARMLGSWFSGVGTNDLKSLKAWLDSGRSGLEPLTRSVEYRYGISLQVYRKEKDGYRQVNPDQTMSAMGISTGDGLSSIMSSYGMNDAFRPLPENEALYKDSYVLRAGHWPEKDTDCVLVLTSGGSVPDLLLYTMGLKDADALNRMFNNVMTGTEVQQDLSAVGHYAPEDFLGISFRVIPASRCYTLDEKLGVWVNRAGDRAAMTALLDEAEEMRIVGVVQPAQGTSFGMLDLGLQYPAALNRRMMAEAGESPVVKAQLAEPEKDVLTGLPFGETAAASMTFLSQMISIHPENLAEVISVDWEGMSREDLSALQLDLVKMAQIAAEINTGGNSPTLAKLAETAFPILLRLIRVNESALDKVITLNMDMAHLQEMYAARAAAATATLTGNLQKFGYADPEQPMGITIYPNNYEDKNRVVALLNGYNAAMEAEGKPERVIRFTDYVGSLMSSVTAIIDVISYILIAFVAISLVVSSIMIGIITYISVLERRKEIGILRALGASRRNITTVFNAETCLIGLMAGIFGIGLTLLLLLPINAVIRSLTDQPVRAVLPAGAGGILVVLCVLLTFIGGLIPARGAARQDPVAALRSE